MSNIRFGRVTNTTFSNSESGILETSTTTSIHEFAPTGSKVTYVDRIQVKSEKEILAHFLKMLDKYKQGDMCEPVFQIRERGGLPKFIEITWQPKQ